MATASTIFLVGGVLSLSYGFVLGVPLSMVRFKVAHAPRHLVTAHLAAIIQGAMLLALSVTVGVSDLPDAVESVGAGLLVVGSVLFVSGAVANWLQRIDDHFAERSLGWKLLSASGGLNLSGIVIVAVGVVRGVV